MMSSDKYTVTFRGAERKYRYVEKDGEVRESKGGHLWYVLHKNGEQVLSAGFHSVEGEMFGAGEITNKDEEIYQQSIPPITIQINQQQFDILNKFGSRENHGANAKSMGFDTRFYNVATHNCVSYVFKALHLIGYNPQDINWGTRYTDLLKKYHIPLAPSIDLPLKIYEIFSAAPGWSYNDVISLLAKHGAIEVKGNNTLIPVSESRSNDIITRPYEITGYDDTHDTIIGGKGNDRLIGGNGDDILIGGNGAYSLDDDYYGSVTVRDDGDDILEGGEGYDIYYIGGKDTIIDSDGRGEIRFLDKDYKMRQWPKEFLKEVFEDGRARWDVIYDLWITDYNPSTGFAVFENTYLRLEATGFEFSADFHNIKCVSPDNPGCFARSITLTDMETGHQVTIENVKNFDLGIVFINPGDGDLYKYTREYTREYLRAWLEGNKEWIDRSRFKNLGKPRSEDYEYVLDENHPASPYYGKGYEIYEYSQLCGSPLKTTKVRGGPITPTPSKPEKEKNDNKVSPDKGGHSRVGTENDDIMHDPNKNADTIFDAGDGNDKIYAGDGDDTLIGGKGNDLLQGGNGKDIYVLEKGHGQDIISEFNTGKDDDTLQFNGINFNDVKFRRDNYDFILFGYNEQDSVTIKAFFANPNNQLEHFQFADRSLSLAQMQTEGITLSGTEKDDIMHDWDKTANTTFNAGDGNDKIYAGDGDDTLIGGKGNDLLQGGNGKDTYVFEKGHGQDIITEFNTSQDDDTLQFNDINFNEVKFRRDNYDLTLFGYNEQDSVTIKAFFANPNNQLEHFQFADRTLSRDALTEEMMLVNNQVDRMVQAMAGFGSQSAGGVISSTQDDVKHQWQLAASV